MALIDCPACGKRISDKAKSCSHCKVDLTADTESIESAQRISAINKRTQLMNHSFVALLAFVGGFALWFWGGEAAANWRQPTGIGLMAAGFVGYLVTRVRLALDKRS
ncbi:zinc ribbon domain-containing protein [Ferrimonas sp. SCSIO 43195]|uniref:zinc ribbon domain-containing protein n=1 Tax=Ferrimonas sp. SCSIO 43195 TaxID=2822844 RepID=UPI0020751522|nr:zinc ribbon domain-containing protein [Ferrimonas sp. SCSIO 43195]USD35772.1 zinc ribbon domain-containing protein [Ferrimonas sp. SCSIO 43195]